MSLHNNINSLRDLPSKQATIEWVSVLVDELRTNNQRQILLCEGSREWCLSLISAMHEIYTPLLLSNQSDVAERLAFSKTETVLGREFNCVIYDQFSGLNIDVLCMASGLVTGGGLLVIIRPDRLLHFDDPYGQWQAGGNPKAYFQEYLDNEFQKSRAVIKLQQQAELPGYQPIPCSQTVQYKDGMTAEQANVLDAMRQWMADKKTPLFLLTADRGRGKSVTLALFANEIMNSKRIVISAAANAQVAILFNYLDPHDGKVSFLAPDELIRRQDRSDVLIIDEAAMLPVSMLQRCMELADKTIMATTTGGYEGTGQGFVLKFLAQFAKDKYLHGRIKDPVRWGKSDLLEQLFNEVLILSSQPCGVEHQQSEISITQPDKKQLVENVALLQAIYSLLVSAHYRTRPSDLRQLMDDDNQLVVVASRGQSVIGVLLLNREGGMQPELCRDIFMGKRRPQGHLFAQMITAQAGIQKFAQFQGLRIQRIAVVESSRKQGIASLLLRKARDIVEQQNLDYIGSSFALDATVALFWKKLGYRVIHIGSGKGKSSGRQTVAVIKSNNEEINQYVQLLSAKLQQNLPVYLLTYCNEMLWQDVKVLLQMLGISYHLSALEHDEIVSVTTGFRGLELSPVSLQKLLISILHRKMSLTADQQRLLIERILLNKDWQQLQAFNANVGRKQLTKTIRQSLNICYECYQTRKSD